MEMLDVVNENGVPTGEVVSREEAHQKGIRHRTSHVWVARIKSGAQKLELSDFEVLVQLRSKTKDSHPGKLDISSAGHIPAGCTYTESAVRELEEELGITVSEQDLHYCGKRRKEYQKNFHGNLFWDNQVSNVYITMKDVDIEDIHIQESELDGIFWMDFLDVYEMVKADETAKEPKSCVAFEEIKMLHEYISDHMHLLV